MIYFKIPLGARLLNAAAAYAPIKAALEDLSPPFKFDDASSEMHIEVAAGGIRDYLVKGHFKLLSDAGVPLPDPRQLDMSVFIDNFATPAYKDRLEKLATLDEARETVRKSPYQDQPDTSAIDMVRPGDQVTADLLAANPGLCIGRGHGGAKSLALLKKAIEQGHADLLFLEEFTTDDQEALDEYLDGDDKDDIPPALMAKLEILNLHNVDWVPVIKMAYEKQAKIYAIDSAEARDIGGSSGTEAFGEQRDVMMNAVVKQVMEGALRDPANTGKKFLAVVGAAHAQTHRGGIPGVTQMFGVPSVEVDEGDGMVSPIKEDKSLRGMPSRDEQMWIDRHIAAEQKRLNLQGEKQFQLRKDATQRAANLKAAGAMPAFEDQQVLDRYEKTAAKDPATQGESAEDIRFAAERKLEQRNTALIARLQNRDAQMARAVAEYVERKPKPGNADQVDALFLAARKDAAKDTLESLTLALDKLDNVENLIAGRPAAPKDSVSLGEMVDNTTIAAEVAAAKAVGVRHKAAVDHADAVAELRKEVADALEEMNKARDTAASLPADMRAPFLATVQRKQLEVTNLQGQIRVEQQAFTQAITGLTKAQAQELALYRDVKGRSVLHHAAVLEDPAAVDAVLTHCEPPRVDLPDTNGNTPLHLACKSRRDMGGAAGGRDQADAMKRLLDAGADANLANSDGNAPAHLAALNNNSKGLKHLIDGGADFDVRDRRGWTPMDVAVGGTSIDAEKLLVDEGKGSDAALADPNAKQTTVELLLAATRCEKPADLARARQAYEKLYADKALRPVLELAALDAGCKRKPPDSGTRIFVADGKHVGKLFAQPPGMKIVPPQGAYDETAGIVMVGNESTNDFAGVLMHELTHMTTQLVNGDKPVPFPDGDDTAKDNYIAALESDTRNMHLMMASSPAEQKVLERMNTRLGEYAQRKGQEGLLEEAIVGIPQLIAEFGSDLVGKLAPALSTYYAEYAKHCKQVADNDPRFAAARRGVDNTALANLTSKTPDQTFKDRFLPADNPALTVDQIVDLIRKDYTVQYGSATADPGVDIVFQTSAYTLTTAQKKELDAKLKVVAKTLREQFGAGVLTLPVATDDLRTLVRGTTDMTHTLREKDLDKAVTRRTERWATDAKNNYLQYKAGTGEAFSDLEMAEMSVVTAELVVDTRADEVGSNLSKHAKAVAKLSTALGQLPAGKKDTRDKQLDIVDKLAGSVSGGKSKGVYLKKGKSALPGSVMLDVSNMKKQWVKTLKTVKRS